MKGLELSQVLTDCSIELVQICIFEDEEDLRFCVLVKSECLRGRTIGYCY